jgi:tRNA-intron endonuclease
LASSASPIRARLVGGVVVVPSIEDSRRLYSMGFYGRPIGAQKVRELESITSPLILDPLEALYLSETRVIEVYDSSERPLGAQELAERLGLTARQLKLYRVYRSLRSRGLTVRSGLKYGASFVAYRRGPGLEHAPFIIHYFEPQEPFDPVELVRAGRLSHSVRKTFIVATEDPVKEEPYYIMLKWLRP